MRALTLPALGLIGLASLASPASAASVFFGEDLGLGEHTRLTTTRHTDIARAGFTSQLTGARVESFESLAAGTYAWTYDAGSGSWRSGRSLAFDGAWGSGGDAVGATLHARTGTVIDVPTGTNGFGRYATDGSKLFQTQASQVEFVFDREIAAFGFDGIDIGDFAGQMTVTTYRGSEVLKTFTIAHALNGQGGDVLFWGIVDLVNPFTRVVLGNTAIGIDVFGLDRIMLAQAQQVVPLPAALPLLASGLAGLAWLRRRRAKAG